MGIILSGGTIVTATDYYQADVRLVGEKIVAIGYGIRRPDDEIMSVKDCLLLPGGIDPHTHFDLSIGKTVTADDFSSGTMAAILGGTTSIIDFATQYKGETLSWALGKWHEKAVGKCYTDYGFHMAITDWNEQIAQEMDMLVQEKGVVSFKFYLAYKNTLQVDDFCLFEALQRSRENRSLICIHCENGDIIQKLIIDTLEKGLTLPLYHPLTRPSQAEGEATLRAITLAEVAQAPLYIVHLTCREAFQAVLNAKERGTDVFAETCPQYLLLDDSYYQKNGFDGAKYVMSPPLRKREDQEVLWQGLRSGIIIDTVATDHCSFNFKEQKELGLYDFSKIPNGIPGVEHRMGLLYSYGVATGRITINQFVALTSTRPAQLFGLFPRKGTITAGSDADIVVWDPNASSVITVQTQHQHVDYTPFEGFMVTGGVRHVFLRGRQVVCNGQLHDEKPGGIYLHRKPFGT